MSRQEERNLALWLATQVGKMELSCSLGTAHHVLQEKFSQKPCNKSFDLILFLWVYGPQPHLGLQAGKKKNLANIQPSWPHSWSITHVYCTLGFELLYKGWFKSSNKLVMTILGQFCLRVKGPMRLSTNPRETRPDRTTRNLMCPTLLDKCVGSLTSTNHVTLKMQETGPKIYSPYLRRYNYKGSTFSVLVWSGLSCYGV